MTLLVLPLLALAWGAANALAQAPAPDAAQRAFFAKLSTQCGAKYEGAASVTPGGPGDLFAGRKLVFHLASCSADEIRIPFAVDDNRSRTIIIRYDSSGLSIKHDHRRADGTPDADTMYGGTGVNGGSALVQSFKADPYTVAANSLRLTNVWIMSLSEDGQTVRYDVDRFDKPLYRSTLRKVSHSAAPAALPPAGQEAPPPGGQPPSSLFNARDLTGWKVPAGDNGHWRILEGVIDYDAGSEAPGDKSLWSERSFGDFVLRVEWRITGTPYVNPRVPIVRYDGTHKKNAEGADIRIAVPDSDSGIFLRGSKKAQVNIWCWPIGSGEVYGYRTDAKMPASVRAAATPARNADRHVGEWNTFEITMRGTRLTVVLNGVTVIDDADLPGIPARGPIGLQHHGVRTDGVWTISPSLVQFRNISIVELPQGR